MKCLLDGDQKIDILQKQVHQKLADSFDCLSNIPIMDILKLINNSKTKKLLFFN